MSIPWKPIGSGLAGVLVGAGVGAVMGLVETYACLFACAKMLGLRDQEGLVILAGAPLGAIHGGIVGLLVGLGVRNALDWVLGALVGLLLWAPLFFGGSHLRSNALILLAFLTPLLCGGMAAALQANRATKQEHRAIQAPTGENPRV